MSIITTFPAVPSRLFSLYAALADSEDGELRQQLEAWATPPSLATRGGGDEDEGASTLFTSALQEAMLKADLGIEWDKTQLTNRS